MLDTGTSVKTRVTFALDSGTFDTDLVTSVLDSRTRRVQVTSVFDSRTSGRVQFTSAFDSRTEVNKCDSGWLLLFQNNVTNQNTQEVIFARVGAFHLRSSKVTLS